MKLRDYQSDAVDAAWSWVKKCTDPCLIEAPTGSGKSWVNAALANRLHQASGKKVLNLAPSAELVEQNYEKYLNTGNPASIFSASAGRKDLRHPVIFGTPRTVVNSLARFGGNISAINIDEAHGVTPTVLEIVDHIRKQNRRVRVIGMTATPHRLGEGYIYQNHYEYGKVDPSKAKNPFFHTLVYSIDPWMLIHREYLTPPTFESGSDQYDTSGLVQKSNGLWDSATVDRAFVGHDRKTAGIVADVVEQSRGRNGVMIFAATIQHAHEVMASLPPQISVMVHGNMKAKERREALKAFKEQRAKYIVNVGVLTTGFDAPHVDVVAILRATESAGLLIQIIGRGLRILEGKRDCLILDYANNLERHCPHGDVFAPEIRARIGAEEGAGIKAECEWCGHVNRFGARPNDEGYEVDKNGYFVDLEGYRIMTDQEQQQPMPAHYGRRCQGETIIDGEHRQCWYMWSHKECESCHGQNDIAARYCRTCGAEIIDPNEKLEEAAVKMADDPYRVRESEVIGWEMQRWPGRDGKPDTIKIDYHMEEHPYTVSEWQCPEHENAWALNRWRKFAGKAWGEDIPGTVEEALSMPTQSAPHSVMYRKKSGSRFFDVLGVDFR